MQMYWNAVLLLSIDAFVDLLVLFVNSDLVESAALCIFDFPVH